MEAGTHLPAEKPAARTPVDLEPVITAAANRGAQIKVGFSPRFHPALLKVHGITAAGALRPRRTARLREGITTMRQGKPDDALAVLKPAERAYGAGRP